MSITIVMDKLQLPSPTRSLSESGVWYQPVSGILYRFRYVMTGCSMLLVGNQDEAEEKQEAQVA